MSDAAPSLGAPLRRHRLGAILVKQLLALVVIELSVRAVAALGLVALPPGGLFGFDQTQHGVFAPEEKRLYQPDRNLVMRMRPNVHLEYPRATVPPGRPPAYSVDTDSHGFRTAPFADGKRPGVFRIICLGDSSTFGMNVAAEDAYPQVLGRLLDATHPGRFEVLNLGTVGYSSRQGIELLRREAQHYQPDLTVFAFGSNDRGWRRPLSDDALIRASQSPAGRFVAAADRALDHTYTYRLLKRGLGALTRRIVDTPDFSAGQFRNSIEGIRDAIVEANALIEERGGTLLVLGTLFKHTDADAGLAMGVAQSGAPYLSGHGLFASARNARTQEVEAGLRLPAAAVPPDEVLFRVQAPADDEVVLEWGPAVDALTVTPMHDDGRAGDQRARDGIWSLLVPRPASGRVTYKYRVRTPTGLHPELTDNLPLFTYREQAFAPDGSGEIDRFGEVYLHSDSAHPDEDGHALLAAALRDQILGSGTVHAFLQHQRPAGNLAVP